MAADLDVRLAPEKALLEETAKAVRHGDVPTRQTARHVVNRARRQRADLLEYTRNVVLAAACVTPDRGSHLWARTCPHGLGTRRV